MAFIYDLTKTKSGELVVLKEINGLEVKTHKRLVELGFVSGVKIKVIKINKQAKLVLIGLRGFTLSMDFLIASKIFVYGENNG